MGERKGTNGKFGQLYQYGVSALKFFQPLFFVAENVGGLRNSNDGNALRTILNELESSGSVSYTHLTLPTIYSV